MNQFIPESILQKYHKLEDVVANLEEHRTIQERKFLTDEVLQAAVERWLCVGIEALTDIGNFILAEYFEKGARRYKDVFIELGKKKVLPKSLVNDGGKMVDFRNRLVHLYNEVDPKIEYRVFQEAPKKFFHYIQEYTHFFESIQKKKDGKR